MGTQKDKMVAEQNQEEKNQRVFFKITAGLKSLKIFLSCALGLESPIWNLHGIKLI